MPRVIVDGTLQIFKTGSTVRVSQWGPEKFQGRTGTIKSFDDGEYKVEIDGEVIPFLEDEIERA